MTVAGLGRSPPGPGTSRSRAYLRESLTVIGVLAIWPLYLVGTALLWRTCWPAGIASIIGLGGFLFTWLAYLRHELWHNYFPLLDNRRMFDVVSYAIFSDPQIFRHVHATHHKFVHTERDLEFFCEGFSTDPGRRRRHFLAELIFGNIAWEINTLFRLLRSGKACKWRSRMALAIRLAFLGGLMSLADQLQSGAAPFVLLTVVCTVWLGAWLTRQSQWIEHLGILVPHENVEERNLLTRNLPGNTRLHRLWNFYTHQEVRDHVLHHTHPDEPSRGRRDLQHPDGVHSTSLKDHFQRLGRYWREIQGGDRAVEAGFRGGMNKALLLVAFGVTALVLSWSAQFENPAAVAVRPLNSRLLSLPGVEGHDPGVLEQWLTIYLLSPPEGRCEEMPPVLLHKRPLPRDWIEAESNLAFRLSRAPPEALEGFRHILEDPKEAAAIRCLLARLFSRIDDPVALPYLETIVDRGEPGALLWESLLLLADHPDRHPAARLRRWADGAQGWGRQYAFVALRRLRDREARGIARRALTDPEPAVVRHAAMYLLELGGPEDAEALDRLSREHWDLETRGVLRRLLDGEARVP